MTAGTSGAWGDRGDAVVVIGAGPAGLMAAECISRHGLAVDVVDAMPSAGRKFLLAGKGGLNLTHSEPIEPFVQRYGERRDEIAAMLRDFTPGALRDWAHGLGVSTFVGTSGRVFPTDMKAAPLLRAWLHRLRERGVKLHMRHRWQGWTDDGALRLLSPAGEMLVRPAATVLALGGASWARLGSDGRWKPWLEARGVEVAPLRPANCGFDAAHPEGDAWVPGWTDHLRSKFAGQPLKSVAVQVRRPDGTVARRQGEFVLTETGVEGSLIYAFAAELRDAIDRDGWTEFELDLLPARTPAQVLAEVTHPRGTRSLSSHLHSRLGLTGVKAALLHEMLDRASFQDLPQLAAAIKALPIRLLAARPIDEAISTAGGVRFEALDEHLMLKQLPGTFCAGEMLDWEAPTGGYLLSACMASGVRAGEGVVAWLRRDRLQTD